jgi:hypothetical protein
LLDSFFIFSLQTHQTLENAHFSFFFCTSAFNFEFPST